MIWCHTSILGHAGIEKLVNTVGAKFHIIANIRVRAEDIAIQSCPDQSQQ